MFSSVSPAPACATTSGGERTGDASRLCLLMPPLSNDDPKLTQLLGRFRLLIRRDAGGPGQALARDQGGTNDDWALDRRPGRSYYPAKPNARRLLRAVCCCRVGGCAQITRPVCHAGAWAEAIP